MRFFPINISRTYGVRKGTEDSAGFDIVVNAVVREHNHYVLKTNVGVVIPKSFVGLLTLRSSSPTKFGIIPLSSPGIIDADYRGELQFKVEAFSNGVMDCLGQFVLQLVVVPFLQSKLEWLTKEYVDEHFSTPRGTGGFGSTTEAKTNISPATTR